MKYILSIDQSTQGTKALLLDARGTLLRRKDVAHRQIISDEGWVNHDPMEIWYNTKRRCVCCWKTPGSMRKKSQL